MPLKCFTQCYGATVQSVIDYSAAIWGTKSMSCINVTKSRLLLFLRTWHSLGRYARNAAINGDMGWLSPEHSQWMCIARKWCRLVNIDESLPAKRYSFLISLKAVLIVKFGVTE